MEGHEMISVGAKICLDGKTCVVKRLEDLPIVENAYSKRFVYDRFESPKLEMLRLEYDLGRVVAEGVDEFDRQVRLMDWVFHRFKRFGHPTCKVRGALDILEAIEGGHAFFCSQYAELMVSAAACMGWVDRIIALCRVDDAPGSTEHSTTEIWSNQHRKWVMFDPTFALYVEKEGIPLNAYEIRDAWFRHGGEDLEFVFGADRERFRGGDMPVVRAHFEGYGDLAFTEKTLNKYAYLGYLPNTNLMTAPKDYLMMFITKDELCDAKPWHKRDAPEHPESEPYFPLGQVALTMTPGEGKTVEVQLQTMTPNFETFRARIDGGAWSDSGDRIVWPPHDGINRLDAVSANWFGVEGPLSAVELEVLQ